MTTLTVGPRLRIVRLTPVSVANNTLLRRISLNATAGSNVNPTVTIHKPPTHGPIYVTNSPHVVKASSISAITDLVEVGREIVVNSQPSEKPRGGVNLYEPIVKQPGKTAANRKSNSGKIQKIDLPKNFRSKTVASLLYPKNKPQRRATDPSTGKTSKSNVFQNGIYFEEKNDNDKDLDVPDHSGSKRQPLCRLCDKVFKTHDAYKRHFATDHPGYSRGQDIYADPWRCMYCGDWFDGPRRLSYHVKSYHKEQLVVKDSVIENKPTLSECKICGAMLKSSLAKHTMKSHPDELNRRAKGVVQDPRQCPLCARLCSGEQGMRNHLYRTHGSSVAKSLLKQGSLYMDLKNLDPDPMPVSSHSVTTTSRFGSLVADPLLVDDSPSADRDCVDLGDLGRHDVVVRRDKNRQSVIIRERRQPIILENSDFDAFQMVEETVVVNDDDIMIMGRDSDDEESSLSFCRLCRVDLMSTTQLAKHIKLNHKPVTCPLCVPLVHCNGLLGLDAHDDNFHNGAIRLQSAETQLP